MEPANIVRQPGQGVYNDLSNLAIMTGSLAVLFYIYRWFVPLAEGTVGYLQSLVTYFATRVQY